MGTILAGKNKEFVYNVRYSGALNQNIEVISAPLNAGPWSVFAVKGKQGAQPIECRLDIAMLVKELSNIESGSVIVVATGPPSYRSGYSGTPRDIPTGARLNAVIGAGSDLVHGIKYRVSVIQRNRDDGADEFPYTAFMTDLTPRKAAPPWLSPLIEFAPLGAFLATWLLTNDLFSATIVVMAASAIAVVLSFVINRKIPWMPLMTAVLVGVFGGLTLYLNDESFIKMKPSMINTLFAVVLLGGMALGKYPLKVVLGHAFEMPDDVWRRLTIRTALFFLALALVNEVVWRSQPTEIWVYFRFPGLMILTFAYFATQIPSMMRYARDDKS